MPRIICRYWPILGNLAILANTKYWPIILTVGLFKSTLLWILRGSLLAALAGKKCLLCSTFCIIMFLSVLQMAFLTMTCIASDYAQ